MLIFVAGYNTVYGQQILYFLDPVFQKRVKIPPPGSIDLFELKEVSENDI